MNLPDYNFLSAPLWLINSLHVITLTLHFVAMNLLVGGLIVILHGRFADRWRNSAVTQFVKISPAAMAATVTLGVAPLLFLQLVFPRQMYGASIIAGWFWLMIVAAVIVGYYLLYRASFRCESNPQSLRWALIGAIVAFIYVSLVYSSVFSLGERPELMKQLYAQSQSELLWNPKIGDYALRWLHMILGAVTVGSYCVGLLGRKDPEAFETGKRFFLWGMAAASLSGMGYLLSLAAHMPAFMSTPGSWSLMLGIMLSWGSLHFFYKKQFVPSGAFVFISLLMMVISRHYVRLVKLRGQFDPASWKIAPQWSPLLLFLICFVVALAVLWYMLRLFFSESAPAKE